MLWAFFGDRPRPAQIPRQGKSFSKIDAGLAKLPPPMFEAADTNHDGSVNSRDALFILQYDASLVDGLGCVF